MTPDLAHRAFDLFTQAERTFDRSSGGLGLGLALVKSLVEMPALLLQTQGHEIAVEHGSLAAIERAKTFRPQACLLDIGLPDIDGYELARRLRALPGMAQVRLVAVTGYGQRHDHDSALAAGFDHHMVKPIDLARLAPILGGTAL